MSQSNQPWHPAKHSSGQWRIVRSLPNKKCEEFQTAQKRAALFKSKDGAAKRASEINAALAAKPASKLKAPVKPKAAPLANKAIKTTAPAAAPRVKRSNNDQGIGAKVFAYIEANGGAAALRAGKLMRKQILAGCVDLGLMPASVSAFIGYYRKANNVRGWPSQQGNAAKTPAKPRPPASTPVQAAQSPANPTETGTEAAGQGFAPSLPTDGS